MKSLGILDPEEVVTVSQRPVLPFFAAGCLDHCEPLRLCDSGLDNAIAICEDVIDQSLSVASLSIDLDSRIEFLGRAPRLAGRLQRTSPVVKSVCLFER